MYQTVYVINDLGKSNSYEVSLFKSLKNHRKEVIDCILEQYGDWR